MFAGVGTGLRTRLTRPLSEYQRVEGATITASLPMLFVFQFGPAPVSASQVLARPTCRACRASAGWACQRCASCVDVRAECGLGHACPYLNSAVNWALSERIKLHLRPQSLAWLPCLTLVHRISTSVSKDR